MSEEKKEHSEHESHEPHEEDHGKSEHPSEHKNAAKTVTIKKDTLWKAAAVVFLALFVISLFTGGFGIGKGVATGNAVTNTGTTANTGSGTTASGDTSIITSNPSLFPSLGPSNAKNTVIEFADFQCPYCAMASGLPNWTNSNSSFYQQYGMSQYASLIGAAKSMENLAQQGKIRFIFVPLSFLDNPSDANGPESTQAAQAAFCADNQGKFWEMHDAIYSDYTYTMGASGPNFEDTGKYSILNLEKIAATIQGINTAKFNSCLENNDTLNKVQQVMTTVQQAGFQISTPQFWVNGKSVSPSTTALNAAIGQ